MAGNDLERLICAWLDGAATPAEQAELDRRLVADPAVAALFARLASLDGHLRERFRAGAAAHAAGTSTITGSFAPTGRRWRLPTAVAAAAALLFAAGAWWWPRDAGLPVIEVADGVEVVRDGATVAVAAGTRLRPGDVLRTGDAGNAVLVWNGNARAELGPGGELALAGPRERALDLRRGALALAAARRGLRVTTPHAALSDGAEADVAAGDYQVVVEPRRTRVDVVAGSWAMAALGSGESLAMRAGDGAEIAAGAPRPRLIDNRLPTPERAAPLATMPLRRMEKQPLDWKRATGSGAGRWLSGPLGVRQTELTPWDPADARAPTPLYALPIATAPGGVLVRAVVAEERVAPGGKPSGFGLVLVGADGSRLLAIKRLHWNGRTLLAVRTDEGLPRPGGIAEVAPSPSGRYRIEVALERDGDQPAWLRARLWPADAPPPEWMASERLPGDCEPRRLGLLTFRSACAFSEVEVLALGAEEPPAAAPKRPF